jgi:hypothetical protein
LNIKKCNMKKGYWCKQRELVTILQEDRTHYLIEFFNGVKICTNKNAVQDIYFENNLEDGRLF